MLTVHIFRHAWAEQADPDRWPDDSLRPLTPEGKTRFRKFAQKLAARAVRCDGIATSPLRRCMQTAEILGDVLHCPRTIDVLNALRPEGDLEEVLRWLQSWPDAGQEVAIVGHAPQVAQMATWFIGGGNLDCPKGGLTSIMFEQSVGPGRGILVRLVKPAFLKC